LKNAQKALFRATGEEQTVQNRRTSGASAAERLFSVSRKEGKALGAHLSVPGTVHLGVLAVGERIDEPKGVLTVAGVEFVQEHRIGGALFPRKFQLGIAENYFAFIGDAEFGSDL
jgi:hypothetical protein